MDMQINPQSDEDSKIQGKIRKRQQADPTIQIIVRTLICIAVIDLSIWGYFAFVKNVPLVTGLKGWQSGIKKTIWGEQPQPFITHSIVITKKQQNKHAPKVKMLELQKQNKTHEYFNTSDEIHNIELIDKYLRKESDIMYSWKDEKKRYIIQM